MEGKSTGPGPMKPPSDEHLVDRINRIGIAAALGVILLTAVTAPFFLPMVLPVVIVVPVIVYLAGRFSRKIYDPTGSTVPSRPAYSGPESFAVRGRFEDAINAYEAAAAEEPTDPEPWLRIARIERMDLKRPQRALEALRAARTRAAPDSATAMMIGREIADVYLKDLKEPPRAMPELARLAAAFPGTPTGTWAAQELTELKERVAAGEFDAWVKGPAGPESRSVPDSGVGDQQSGNSSRDPGDSSPSEP